MSAHLMKQGRMQAVIVGADRIAANGDTANKIGTYGVSILAREHGIPFYVAAPWSTIDVNTAHGDLIPIEQRNPREVTHSNGIQMTPTGVAIENPAFDVTPAKYITAIITERGVLRAPFTESIAQLAAQSIPTPEAETVAHYGRPLHCASTKTFVILSAAKNPCISLLALRLASWHLQRGTGLRSGIRGRSHCLSRPRARCRRILARALGLQLRRMEYSVSPIRSDRQRLRIILECIGRRLRPLVRNFKNLCLATGRRVLLQQRKMGRRPHPLNRPRLHIARNAQMPRVCLGSHSL
jgi:hypothetical protein